MGCPTLAELPPPPSGKSGWPWTEESKQVPVTQLDGSPWPKISIVTPSFNQGAFIEETIRAVLLQGYPDIEYMVIDGGSQDETPDILKKYEAWLTYWVSEPDRGQAHAINKGFERATGKIYYWINSDDFPAKNMFAKVAEYFTSNPTSDVIYGDCYYINEFSRTDKFVSSIDFSLDKLVEMDLIGQPAAFFRADIWKNYGPTREALRFIMDYELWLRWALEGVNFEHLPALQASFRVHSNSKTTRLSRVSQNETITLLFELKNSGKLPINMYPHIKNAIYRLCLISFGDRDFQQYWRNLFNYVKHTHKIPPASLLLRGLLVLFGRRFNDTLSAIKHKIMDLKPLGFLQ